MIELEIDFDEPIIPKRIGLCANFIGAFDMCGRAIFEDDIEMVELPPKNNRKQFICGQCVNRLLSAKPIIELPEKMKSHHRGRTGARLSKGPNS